ncbi:MAG: hypothetical protein WAM60_12570 [Candidatus Promineifilaceae bacterium]
MLDGINIFAENISNQKETKELVGRLFDTAKPEAAFGKPVTQGEYTVITASEVSIGMGVGYGGGGGTDQKEAEKEASGGFGGGGGGGGMATARPIAAIEIGPEGVIVEPIVDVTKIALAFFTALGSMGLMFARMNKASKK